jgi:hypothetical protein
MRARGQSLLSIVALGAVLSIAAAHTARADQNSRRGVDEKADRTASAEQPYRALYGWAEIYIPTYFVAHNGTYDLVIHFHGAPFLQEENFDRLRLNAIVVSVNMGIASGMYSENLRGTRPFESLLASTQQQIEKSGRAPGAHLGRIALSAWSAGFGAVGSILATPENAERIDAVFLEDGPHANYLGSHVVNDGALAKYVDFAVHAMKGEKLFALTHSSIMTEGYPSTT